ncbi:hypothetical Protein YC6258_01981 [Gynuella sunshinyii YC6258]|uniref:Uncharacterized protein n=1 Tax=Gynuella sunshinyii YC6258 TaxID=1445510 RepID=A0A0C5V3B4_9GAMM|nr:hypothetical Protein YC6258_01981 [Gynuella sunshinyii YC6258]
MFLTELLSIGSHCICAQKSKACAMAGKPYSLAFFCSAKNHMHRNCAL